MTAFQSRLKLSTLGSCVKVCASIVQLLRLFQLVFIIVSLYLAAVGSVFILAAVSSCFICYRSVNDIYGDATGRAHRLRRERWKMHWKGWVNNWQNLNFSFKTCVKNMCVYVCVCRGSYLGVWERFSDGAVCEIWSVCVWGQTTLRAHLPSRDQIRL